MDHPTRRSVRVPPDRGPVLPVQPRRRALSRSLEEAAHQAAQAEAPVAAVIRRPLARDGRQRARRRAGDASAMHRLRQSRQQFAAGGQAAATCVMVVPEIGAEVAIEGTVTVTPANQAVQDSSAAALGKVRKCGEVFAFIGPDRDIPRSGACRQLPNTIVLVSRLQSEAISVELLTWVPSMHWSLWNNAAQSSSPKHEHHRSVHSAARPANGAAARHIEAVSMPAVVPNLMGTSSACASMHDRSADAFV